MTIAMPSEATSASLYATPFFSHSGTSSSVSIGREASEMSVSPAQNFSKPPPVPDWPTVIFTFGFSVWNCSAAAWANGKTVLEPSMAISPLTPSPPEPPLLSSSSLPQAARPRARTAVIARTGQCLKVKSFSFSVTALRLSAVGPESVTELWP